MRFQWRTLALAAAALTQAAAQSTGTTTTTSSSASSRPTATPTPGSLRQSVFVAPDQEMAFGITIPDSSVKTDDIYFSLAGQPSGGWAAVGLGASTMLGNPLILMVYASEDGANVTFSPRLATRGRAEPVPYPDLKVAVLPGTGFKNGTLVVRARCSNCRRWPGGGSLDVGAAALPCIYAAGPSFFRNSDADAPLKMHRSFGSFTIDMRAATAAAGDPLDAPVLNAATTTRSVGAAIGDISRTGKRDWAAIAHAVIMIFCFVGLLPLGIIMLRVGEWVRPHGINQGIALVGIIVGFGLGVHASGRYNRSKNFNSAHQVIGILVFIFLFVQFAVGFLHHRNYRRSQSQAEVPVPKKTFNLRPVHIWLGRSVMLMGIVNAFVGFPFALSPGYNLILAPLALAVLLTATALLFLKGFVRKCLFGRKSQQPSDDDAPPSYTQEPWRQPYPMGTSAGATAAPPPPAASRGGQGLFGLSGLRGLMKGRGAGADAPGSKEQAGMELGSRQHPRELV